MTMRTRKWFFLFLALLLFIVEGCGTKTHENAKVKPAQYPGWVVVKAGDDAEFAVPPQIEIETEEFRKKQLEQPDGDRFVRAVVSRDAILAEGKGNVVLINTDFKKVPWEQGSHFARVTFQTIASPTKLPRYGQNLGMDSKALKDFETATKEGIQFAVRQGLPDEYEISCRNWKPMRTAILNGVEHLYISYDEVLTQKGQPVMTFRVYRWTFLNNDRLHVLAVYTNLADAEYWNDEKHNPSNIVKTLLITPSDPKKNDSLWSRLTSFAGSNQDVI